MPIEEHQDASKVLSSVDAELKRLRGLLGYRYPAHLVKKVDKAREILDDLRNALSGELFIEHPDKRAGLYGMPKSEEPKSN